LLEREREKSVPELLQSLSRSDVANALDAAKKLGLMGEGSAWTLKGRPWRSWLTGCGRNSSDKHKRTSVSADRWGSGHASSDHG
jgi:hypothetical protein